MKPNKPGFWHERKGLKARVWASSYGLMVELCGPDYRVFSQLAGIENLPGDDWLPVIEPEFPSLPTKPRLVLARFEDSLAEWFGWDETEGFASFDTGYEPGELTAVPHPDNDPEAVRRIEEAAR